MTKITPWDLVRGAEPIYIDAENVSRWIGMYGFDTDMSDLIDQMPRICPFEYCQIIYKIHTINTDTDDIKYAIKAAHELLGRVKATVICLDLKKYGNHGFLEDARFNMTIDLNSDKTDFIASVSYDTDDHGDLINGVRYAQSDAMDNIPEAYNVFMNLIYPAYVTIALMHVKNIELIDKPISRQVRRQAERKNKKLKKYKVLAIEPFKKRVRSEKEPHESEIRRALHIARGHFRTYTEDRPLFGKHSGTFWIPAHLRGSKEYGTIEKDYKVNPK